MNTDSRLERELVAVHVRAATAFGWTDRTETHGRMGFLPVIAGIVVAATTAAAASYWI